MGQSISSNISNFVSDFSEQRNRIWDKYRNSLSFVARLKELETVSSEVSANSTLVQGFNNLGSGQPPDEICLAVSEIDKEVEAIKLLEAEIESLEKEIKKFWSRYIRAGIIFLVVGLAIWLWHVGWFIQVLILVALLFLFIRSKKR